MSRRNTPKTPGLSPLRQTDPWRSAAPPGNAETSGGWVLSYLDVMTILFTFFVLLFAYQKAMTTVPTKTQRPNVVSQAKAKTSPPNPVKPSSVPAQPEPTQHAVAAMKAQASARGMMAGSNSAENIPTSTETGELTEHALSGAAQLASEQTARLMAKALEKEAERQQVEIVREGRRVRVELSDAILFEPGSAELRGEGFDLLDRLNTALSTGTDTLFVEGHTDPSPIANSRFPSNWELSSARAAAVTRQLIAKGLPAERLRAVGLADTRPRADNSTPEGRARNRRVTIIMSAAPTS